ncbi:MAG: hypothetical protein WBA22_04105 [Candidatus Methanofastidiosia archaeon]
MNRNSFTTSPFSLLQYYPKLLIAIPISKIFRKKQIKHIPSRSSPKPMESWNGGSENSNDIERDFKQQKCMWSGITGEFMKHWILKAERQQKRFLSEGYTHMSRWTVLEKDGGVIEMKSGFD